MLRYKFLGAMLLIASTCIGVGMLALPISTAPLGFGLSVLVLLGVWAFMCFTGLLVIEANLRLPKNTSYISMAGQTLGKPGQIITWFCFLLLLYSLIAAHITGGGALLAAVVKSHFHAILSPTESYLPWIIAFSAIVFCGTVFIDVVNRLFILGLLIAFAALVTVVSPHVKFHLLTKHAHINYLLLALPVLFTSFGYHVILPSMRNYVGENIRKLRWMIILGSLLPFCFYAIWEFLIFGVIPIAGHQGLMAILKSAQPTNQLTYVLGVLTQHAWIDTIAKFFVFFALAGSFIGVALGLFDLLADGLKIKKNIKGRSLLVVLTFLPPFLFALFYPHGFVLALGYAGVFVAILHGIFPALMAWRGRNRHELPQHYYVCGGRMALVLVCLISLVVIVAQLC